MKKVPIFEIGDKTYAIAHFVVQVISKQVLVILGIYLVQNPDMISTLFPKFHIRPSYLLEAGGEPSTWLPPGGLVKPSAEKSLTRILTGLLHVNLTTCYTSDSLSKFQ